MCLEGAALDVKQYAKKVDFSMIETGHQPQDTILAWRMWKIESLFPSVTLRSNSQRSTWTPGKPMDAHATIKQDHAQVGVHAYKSMKDLIASGDAPSKTDYKQETHIVGQVLLWGKIAEHKNGYRAEHGYPFLLYINGSELQMRLEASYKCQVASDFIPRVLAEAA